MFYLKMAFRHVSETLAYFNFVTKGNGDFFNITAFTARLCDVATNNFWI
jgi:hypothetical protein